MTETALSEERALADQLRRALHDARIALKFAYYDKTPPPHMQKVLAKTDAALSAHYRARKIR